MEKIIITIVNRVHEIENLANKAANLGLRVIDEDIAVFNYVTQLWRDGELEHGVDIRLVRNIINDYRHQDVCDFSLAHFTKYAIAHYKR